MKRLILVATFALAACAPGETSQQIAARVQAEDHRECVSYGLERGTDQYTACRLALKQLRARNNAATMKALMDSSAFFGEMAGPRVLGQ